MEFYEHNDETFRFESRGHGIYSIYVEYGDHYIHDAIVSIKGKYNGDKVYEAYQEALELRE